MGLDVLGGVSVIKEEDLTIIKNIIEDGKTALVPIWE